MSYTKLPADEFTEKRASPKSLNRLQRLSLITLFAFFILGVILYPSYWVSQNVSVCTCHRKQNVIFMVSDGMGPASLSLARSFKQYRDKLDIDDVLTLDLIFIGSSRTRSNDSLVTDSAAGATAFSCGLKTYNGAIGVNPEKTPCGTILEALKLKGWLTGLVVTTRITDATPASFSAHTDYRSQEDLIAQQQLGEYPLGRMVDLMIGGGRCHFLPKSVPGGCREDERDLIKHAQKQGWSYAGDRAAFDALEGGRNVSLPLLSLLAPKDIPYDIDRDSSVYPSLAEQVKTALTALSEATKDSDEGFFLLIEGSRIDHAGHHNDPAAQVREVLAYDEAMKEVLKFVDGTDVVTTVISTSDHETGGLATARQVSAEADYLWYPEVLLNSSHSGEFLVRKVVEKYVELADDEAALETFLTKEIIEQDMGIKDHTKEEVAIVKSLTNDASKLLYFLNNMISVRSQTGWSTLAHSAVDVNIYAYSNSEYINKKLFKRKPYTGLAGNHENIEIGAFMANITHANLTKVTELIKDTQHSPSGAVAIESESFHGHAIQQPVS